MQGLTFHFETYLRFLILWGYSAWLYSMWSTNTLQLYVHHRFFVYTMIACGALLFMAVIQLSNTIKENGIETGAEDKTGINGHDHNHSVPGGHSSCAGAVPESLPVLSSSSPRGAIVFKVLSYAIFVIPLVIGFSAPPRVLDPSIAGNRGFFVDFGDYYEGEWSGTRATEAPGEDIGYNNSSDHGQDVHGQGYHGQEQPGYARDLEPGQPLTVDELNFFSVSDQFWFEPAMHHGREVTVSGFVYSMPELDENQLILGRYLITCCVADAIVIGFLAEFPPDADIEEFVWLKITGEGVMGEFNNQEVGMIKVDEYREVEQPDFPYLYW